MDMLGFSKAWQGRKYSSGLGLLDHLNRHKVTIWPSFLRHFRRATRQLCAVYLLRAIGDKVALSKALQAINAIKGLHHPEFLADSRLPVHLFRLIDLEGQLFTTLQRVALLENPPRKTGEVEKR